MVAYLVGRAAAAGKAMGTEVAVEIVDLGGPVPNYVQELADASWREAGDVVDSGAVLRGLDETAALQQADFVSLFANLSAAQGRVLQLLASQPTEHPNAATFVRAAGVTNRGVNVALATLDDLGLALRHGRQWMVPNPFLRRWLT